jgi:DNA-binding NarL/FixJ family response regulator
VEAATTVDEILALLFTAAGEVDLVLLDLHMPGNSGFTGLFLLQTEFPTVPVAILSAEHDPRTIRRAISYGALGYIPKSLSLDEMGAAIISILGGEIWTPAGALEPSGADGDVDLARRFSSLTAQQLRILTRIVEGKLNKQIADDLKIAEQTVKVHVSTILRKLNVLTRTQAAILAERLIERHHRT